MPIDLDAILERRGAGPLTAQAVREVHESVAHLAGAETKGPAGRVFQRIVEPDRVLRFRITWERDDGTVEVNRAWRIQQSSALGPYKGGLRFHPTVSEDVLGFLAFEQSLKNALTGIPMGGAKGGADVDPKSMSESEMMRFCHAFMGELARHIGPDEDVPAGDIGVGSREVGFLFGAWKKLTRRHVGVLTGKPLVLDGLPGRDEATGYGLLAFVNAMLSHAGKKLEGMRVAVSGAGNVSLHAAERAAELGARVVSLSDSGGLLAKASDFSADDLRRIKSHKLDQRGRLADLHKQIDGAAFTRGADPWGLECDIALPCATQDELDGDAARALVKSGVRFVAEGANMPTTDDAVRVFREAGVPHAPGKASNAGGVATSGFEMSANAQRLPWSREQTLERLAGVMRHIHEQCVEHGTTNGSVNYFRGANIAAYNRLAEAVTRQGLV